MSGTAGRRLKNGAAAHELTAEERRRGGLTRAENLRQERAQARERANERLRQLLDKALDRLETELDADDGDFRAIREVLDRNLGKPTQPVELEPAAEGLDMFLADLRLTVYGAKLEKAIAAGDIAAARRALKEAKR